MKTADWPRVRVLFAEICDLDEVEQQRRINALTLSEPDRGLLDSMLAADRQQRLGDDAEAHTPRRATVELDDDRIGSIVGAWRIDALIGAGGMGRVYRARREDGLYEGLAAIKFVAEAANPSFFATERHVLARLAHAGIARLLDAGEDSQGRPFLVMEYIAGSEIDDYCADAHAGAERRIELIAAAARAIAHAHGQMVLHRDIKPGNLLVDNSGQIKVLDFGIAKLLDRSAQDQRQTAARYFTPRYAAPEQIAGEPAGVAVDVFALAVVLFELLTHEHPFASDFETKRSLAERVLAGDATPLRRVLKLDPGGLLSALSAERVRDLEAVLGKALSRAPAARYASAQEFADELQRVLDNRPVVVRVPSLATQLTRLASQHRLGVTLGAAAIVAFMTLSVVAVWQAREARQQAQVAEQRATELEQVSKFQAQMLGQVDAYQAGKSLSDDVAAMFAGEVAKDAAAEADRAVQIAAFAEQWRRINSTDAARNLIDRTILKPAVKAIDLQFENQPLVDAALRQSLADLYSGMGLDQEALPLQESALATRREHLGPEHPETLRSSLANGVLLRRLGKPDLAEPYYQEALDGRRRVLGNEHVDTLYSIASMGNLRQFQGRLDEAEPYIREALETSRRVLGPNAIDTLTYANNMGILLRTQAKFDAAEPLAIEALTGRRRVLGEDHPSTLQSMNSLGALLRAQGRFAEAEPLFREALEKHRRILGDDHPSTLMSINNMGAILQDQGKLAEAATYARDAVERRRKLLGDDNPATLMSITNLAHLLMAQGKLPEAERYWSQALSKQRRILGNEHPNTLDSIGNLGILLQAEGKLDEAATLLNEAVAGKRRLLGDHHPSTLKSIISLGSLLQAQGQDTAAIALLDPATAAIRSNFAGSGSARIAALLLVLGQAHAASGQHQAAEAELLESESLLAQILPADPIHHGRCLEAIVDLYVAWGAAEPNHGYAAKATGWQRRLDGIHAGSSPTPSVRN